MKLAEKENFPYSWTNTPQANFSPFPNPHQGCTSALSTTVLPTPPPSLHPTYPTITTITIIPICSAYPRADARLTDYSPGNTGAGPETSILRNYTSNVDLGPRHGDSSLVSEETCDYRRRRMGGRICGDIDPREKGGGNVPMMIC